MKAFTATIARLDCFVVPPARNIPGSLVVHRPRIPPAYRGFTQSSNRNMTSSASSAKASSRLLAEEDGEWKPPFVYGTAWKKDRTTELVKLAVQSGFRSVDTAAQPRHYQEKLVGDALRELYAENVVAREDLYLQTKYTTPAGQDPNNMPYDASAPLENQIRTSVASSLKNLRPSPGHEEGSYVDCLLLHSPLPTVEQTLQAWAVLESYVPEKIRLLGISNVTLPVLKTIYENSSIKPSVVQNRFYPQTRYDGVLRSYCNEHNIVYQSFWTLTGNPRLLKSDPVARLSDMAHVSKEVALYALVMDQGIAVLNGTTSADRMKEDLSGIRKVQHWAHAHEREWSVTVAAFSKAIQPSLI